MATNLSTRRPTSGPEEFTDEWMAQQQQLMNFGGEAAALTTPAQSFTHLDPSQEMYSPDEINPDDSWRDVPILGQGDEALIQQMADKAVPFTILHVSEVWQGDHGQCRTVYFSCDGSQNEDGNALTYGKVLSAGADSPFREERLEQFRTVCLNGKKVGPCMFVLRDTKKGNAFLHIATWRQKMQPALPAGRKSK